MASNAASRGVGRNGDPAMGGESTLVVLCFDPGVPFGDVGIEVSAFAWLRRVAM